MVSVCFVFIVFFNAEMESSSVHLMFSCLRGWLVYYLVVTLHGFYYSNKDFCIII